MKSVAKYSFTYTFFKSIISYYIIMSSKPTYNIVLNSNFCTAASVVNTNSNKEYYVDWSAILPNKKFKLSYSFISEGCYITTFTSLPIISTNLLTSANIIQTQASFQSTSSSVLGLVFPTYLDPNAHIAYFRNDKNFNNEVYTSRPFSNNFYVKIQTNANPPAFWVDQTLIPEDFPQYVLILSFEECD